MSTFIGPRIAAICGVAFAILLMLAVMSVSIPHGGNDQEFIDWYADSANRSSSIVGGYFMFGAAVAFILFFSFVRERLNEGSTGAGNVVFSLAVGAFALLLVAAALRGAIATAVTQSDEPLPGADTLRYIPQIGRSIITFAMLTTGVTAASLFLAVRKTAALPAWFGVASGVFGVLIIAGTVVVGPFIIPVVSLWAVVASVAVVRGAPATATASLRPAAASS